MKCIVLLLLLATKTKQMEARHRVFIYNMKGHSYLPQIWRYFHLILRTQLSEYGINKNNLRINI